jgi:GTPase SAR1 family protein
MKIVILGDSGVGKTAWVHSLLGYNHSTKPTMGVDIYPYKYNGKKLTLWDTGDNGLRGGYFLGAKYAIIFYKKKSSLEKYKQEILDSGKNIPFVAYKISEINTPEKPFEDLFAKKT